MEDRRSYAGAVRRHLRSQPLTSPKHEIVTRELDAALCEAESEPPGARTILSLSAPFAVGKSSQIKHWARAHYRQWVTNPDSERLPEWEDSMNRPGVSGGSVPWEGWSHVREYIEEVSGRAA